MKKTKKLIDSDLSHFTGSTVRYRHSLNRRVFFSEGVQFVADEAGAYWLIDAIASYFGTTKMRDAISVDERLRSLQFWRLEVDGSSATLTARADSDTPPFITQEIPFTDFPLPNLDVWAGGDGDCWMLYLPSEH